MMHICGAMQLICCDGQNRLLSVLDVLGIFLFCVPIMAGLVPPALKSSTGLSVSWGASEYQKALMYVGYALTCLKCTQASSPVALNQINESHFHVLRQG
jgi:hypothetical protein